MKRMKWLLLVSLGSVLVLLAPSGESDAAVYTSPIRTCQLSGARVERSSPVPADLDGDGTMEIVVAGSDGRVYAVDVVDNCRVLWSKQVADYVSPVAPRASSQSIQSSPTVADLTGDGEPEIVLTTGWMPEYHMNGAIVVLDRFGNLVPGWPRLARDVHGAGVPPWNPDGYADGFFGTAAVGDVTGDDIPEIVVGGFDKCVYVMEPNGSPAPGWWDTANNRPARCLIDTIWSSPALADLNQDGVAEIIIGTDAHPQYNGGSVWVFYGDNTLFPGWPVYTTQTVQSSPAVADIDGDGRLDVVVGTGTYYPGTGGYRLYAFDRNGNNLPGWPVATSGNMPNSPAVADLDSDGKMEIVTGCGSEPDYADPNICNSNHVYAWNHDAVPLSGYPASLKKAIPWDPPAYGAAPVPPVLADANADGKAEVFLVGAGAVGVTVFPYDRPDVSALYTPMLSESLQAAPLLVDLYGDGSLSMVTAGSASGRAALFLWNLRDSAEQAPWPMYRGNVNRTGTTVVTPRLSSLQASVYLLHQQYTTTPEQRVLTISNAGGGRIEWQILSKPSAVSVNQLSGVVEDQDLEIELTVQTISYQAPGTYYLGEVVIAGTYDGEPVLGSPMHVPVTITVGDISRSYVPLTCRGFQ